VTVVGALHLLDEMPSRVCCMLSEIMWDLQLRELIRLCNGEFVELLV
jgi:hypothetical protein